MVGVRGFENVAYIFKILFLLIFLLASDRQNGDKWRFLAVRTANLPPLKYPKLAHI